MLTLPEELLLLSLDEHGHSHGAPPLNLDLGLLACAVLELQLRGRVEIEPDAVRIRESAPSGDRLLDEVQAKLGKPASLEDFLESQVGSTAWVRERVLEQLATKGVVRQESGRTLWLIPQRRYSVEHGADEVSLLERLGRALVLHESADRRTSLLLAIVAATFTTDAHLRDRLFAEMRDRMYEIVNSGGEVQGLARDAVCAALASAAPQVLPTLLASPR